jgi:acid phosphatase family membrane protein YuiD
MNYLTDGTVRVINILRIIITHKIFYSTFITWFIAQFMKFGINFIRHKKIDFRLLVGTGGMPSSHTAAVIALSTSVGMYSGFDSAIFMVALLYAIVVISDALGVRRAAGNQARVLNKIVDEFEHKQFSGQRLKELLGHTPIETAAGIAIGIFFSILIYNW